MALFSLSDRLAESVFEPRTVGSIGKHLSNEHPESRRVAMYYHASSCLSSCKSLCYVGHSLLAYADVLSNRESFSRHFQGKFR